MANKKTHLTIVTEIENEFLDVCSPDLERTEIVLYREDWPCDVEGCSGKMVYNKYIMEIGCDKYLKCQFQGWPHSCDVCGVIKKQFDTKFPRIVYEEKPL